MNQGLFYSVMLTTCSVVALLAKDIALDANGDACRNTTLLQHQLKSLFCDVSR